jgi:hypothetical protein
MSGLSSTLFVGNDNIMRLVGLTDTTGVVQNDATVTIEEIIDLGDDQPIGGVAFPIAMNYVPTSAGTYEGVLPHTLEVQVGRDYQAKVRVIASSGRRGEWEERLRARLRRG